MADDRRKPGNRKAGAARRRPRPVGQHDHDAGKMVWKPGNLVIPAPAALVSCMGRDGKSNLITVAWCGNVNSSPPMLSISVRPIRHSHAILVESGEFVVNIPAVQQAQAVDYCGVVSGRDIDKFASTGLTPAPAGKVACPLVAECPVNISCRIEQRHSLGSHDLFLAMVEEVAVDSRLMDASGRFLVERANFLCYAHGFYFSLGSRQGHFGWSVRKRGIGRKTERK